MPASSEPGWKAGPTVVLIGLLCLPTVGRGQEPSTPRLSVSGGGEFLLLVGADVIDGGIGPHLGLQWHPTSSPWLRVAVDGSLSPLEDDADEDVGVRAENTTWTFVAGPELSVSLWRLEPHLAGLAGIMTGRWSVEGPTGSRAGGSVTFVWGGEAGLDVRLFGGRHPVHLTTGFRVLDGGELDFAYVFPMTDPGPGSVRSENIASLALRVGLRVGL